MDPSGEALQPPAEPRPADSGGSSDKGYRLGTHRRCAPEVTLQRLQRWLPVLGITRVANVTGLDTLGLPVVMVCRPNARSLSVSQGKGLTLAAAKVSGIMESLELHHAERIELPLERSSWREIGLRRPVVDVERLEPPHGTKSLFHEDRRMLWIEGRELLKGGPIWLPFETVHMDLTVPLPDGSGCFHLSSNGLASGNHPMEALSHGLCEVIERDAVSRWMALSKAQRADTRLDLETADNAEARKLLEPLSDAGLTVAVWDATSPVGIPTYHCEIASRQPDPWRPIGVCRGSGCHLDPGVALLRALTESVQTRLTLIAGSRDDLNEDRMVRRRQPDVLRTWHQKLEAEAAQAPNGLDFGKRKDLSRASFEDDVATLLRHLQQADIQQVAAVDLTHPGLRIPVVRVVVPGLLNALD